MAQYFLLLKELYLCEEIYRNDIQKNKSPTVFNALLLPLLDGFLVIKLPEILYCEAQDNFTCLCMTDGQKHLICRKLKFYENTFSQHGFCRVHRSFMINLEYVKRYIKGKGGMVILENGKEIPVANARKGAFLEQLQ